MTYSKVYLFFVSMKKTNSTSILFFSRNYTDKKKIKEMIKLLLYALKGKNTFIELIIFIIAFKTII